MDSLVDDHILVATTSRPRSGSRSQLRSDVDRNNERKNARINDDNDHGNCTGIRRDEDNNESNNVRFNESKAPWHLRVDS